MAGSDMSKITKQLACQIRPHVSGMDWETARDFIDQYTGNELDCKQLDLLTDWSLAVSRDDCAKGGR